MRRATPDPERNLRHCHLRHAWRTSRFAISRVVDRSIVATGDMLGQMAAEDYPERLAGLYLEFREATIFSRFQKTSFARSQKSS